MQDELAEPINPMEVKKNATYSMPVSIYLWLKEEARRRETDASTLLVKLVRAEQERVAA